jgi:hypothetical protein
MGLGSELGLDPFVFRVKVGLEFAPEEDPMAGISAESSVFTRILASVFGTAD